ncbi:MAG: hypothetical protein MJ249_14745 [Kiritimatiellae bacterium]|nr:hypothetical protein [Kiritimatiellia bacterium]
MKRIVLSLIVGMVVLCGNAEVHFPVALNFNRCQMSLTGWKNVDNARDFTRSSTWGAMVGLPVGSQYGNVYGAAVDLGLFNGQFNNHFGLVEDCSIWGVQVGVLSNFAWQMNGIQAGSFICSNDQLNGLGVALCNNSLKSMRGAQIGLYNLLGKQCSAADTLVGSYGLQLGLVNRYRCGRADYGVSYRSPDDPGFIIQIGLVNLVNDRYSWPLVNVVF